MEIPWQGLQTETLRRVVEEFVTREGTDYGLSEYSLEQKVDHVLRQLRRGQVVLCFDPELESCHIQPLDSVRARNKPQLRNELDAEGSGPA